MASLIYPDGSIIEGGFVPATDSVPTQAGIGCIFLNVTFVNPAKFGEGCIFVGCTFLDYNSYYNTQPHRTGKGNVFTDCSFNYVIFGEDNVSNTPTVMGYRPNQGEAYIEPTNESTPALSSFHCPSCGAIVFASNGKLLVDAPMLSKEEHAGGKVVSSGVCAKCS